MRNYSVALFIGRFQPFHKGHLYSLEKCLELADKVIVGIGSSQESGTANNPYDFEKRKQMVMAVDPTVQIVAVPDDPSDEVWVATVDNQIKKLGYKKEDVVVVSNNEWVTRTLSLIGYPIYQTGLFNREELEGVKIRELMRAQDVSFKSRVPEQVLPFLS